MYNGVGYKNGYRLRSNGEETTSEFAFCTGFIKVQALDFVYMMGWNLGEVSKVANSITLYDAEFVWLGQTASSSSLSYGVMESFPEYNWQVGSKKPTPLNDLYYRFQLPPCASIAYMRIAGYMYPPNGGICAITINRPIIY